MFWNYVVAVLSGHTGTEEAILFPTAIAAIGCPRHPGSAQGSDLAWPWQEAHGGSEPLLLELLLCLMSLSGQHALVHLFVICKTCV